MPIYEYRCASCGFQKEYLQKVTDALLTVCPECGQDAFNKLVSAAGFQLKGTGWYATDFKNNGSRPAKREEGGEKAAKQEDKGDKTVKEESAAAPTCGAGACPACS